MNFNTWWTDYPAFTPMSEVFNYPLDLGLLRYGLADVWMAWTFHLKEEP